MSKLPAIQVEGLGKEYLLGGAERQNETFRDVLTGMFSEPLRKLRRLSGRDEEQERLWALLNVNFEVFPGEVIGIIGRNGAGKSTLLKVLTRITEPTLGRAITRGRVASLLEVGTGFHPELTGRENIFLNGAILGMTKAELVRRFDAIVDFAEVEEFLDTPVKRYSSGMFVRLAFSVAAHIDPEILLVDEVLAVGDLQFRKKCLGAMSNLSQTGRTVLFVSHNTDSVRSLCSRGVWMEQGKIKKDDEVNTVVDAYLAASLGQGQEGNILRCRVERGDHSYSVDRIEIYDYLSNPKKIIRTGDDVVFKIVYYSPNEIANGSVVFKISTTSGTVLSLCSTKPDQNYKTPFVRGVNSIALRIKSFPFAAGDYVVGVALAIPWREYLYEETEFAVISIYDQDIYSSGLAPRTNRYHVALNCEWD